MIDGRRITLSGSVFENHLAGCKERQREIFMYIKKTQENKKACCCQTYVKNGRTEVYKTKLQKLWGAWNDTAS